MIKLKNNWGDKANSMDCMVEVRVYDPLSSWECYIFAMNPDNEDEISCIIKGFFVEIVEAWSVKEIMSRFNSEGESLQIDYEYRPRKAAELFKTLCEVR